jgi:hypothetical protein
VINGALTWYNLAYQLAQAVQEALTVDAPRVSVVPGEIAWDDADCGAVYATWNRVFYSDVFPEPVSHPAGNCWPTLKAAEFVLQIVRCTAPPPGLPGGLAVTTGPAVEDLEASAQQLSRDTEEASAAVARWLCQAMEDNDISNWLAMEITPVGPLGNAVAVELHVLVAVTNGG